jgi:hypothetical protein
VRWEEVAGAVRGALGLGFTGRLIVELIERRCVVSRDLLLVALLLVHKLRAPRGRRDFRVVSASQHSLHVHIGPSNPREM